MKRPLFAFLLLFAALSLSSQSNADRYQLRIKKSTVPIKLDGALDEAAWQTGDEKADHFKLSFPNDTAYSQWQTEARVTFDEQPVFSSQTGDLSINIDLKNFQSGVYYAFVIQDGKKVLSKPFIIAK